jgi:hypothetical protein
MGGFSIPVPFRFVTSLTPTGAGFSAGGVELSMAGISTGRLPVFASLFEYFHFIEIYAKVKSSVVGVSLVTPASTVTSGGLISVVSHTTAPRSYTVAPANFNDCLQQESFDWSGGDARPLELRLGRQQLFRHSSSWFRTNTVGTPPPGELSQGYITFAYDLDSNWSGVNPTLTMVIEGVCVFTGMTDNAVGTAVASHEEKCIDDTVVVGRDSLEHSLSDRDVPNIRLTAPRVVSNYAALPRGLELVNLKR